MEIIWGDKFDQINKCKHTHKNINDLNHEPYVSP